MSTNTAGQAKRQKTGDDSSTAAEDDRNNVSVPTEEDISSALCRIENTDQHYSAEDVNKAFDNLDTWGWSNNNQDERGKISKDFMDLSVIQRTLISIQGNKDNVGFMLRASKVISMFLYPGSNDEHLENASTMAQKFVECKGVEKMLSIIKEKYTGELNVDQLTTLCHIFDLFTNTMRNMNAKNMVDIDKFPPIIDAGISTMAVLSNISTHDVDVASIKGVIFLFIRNFVDYNAEMIDVVEFHNKNIFQKCVRAVKNPDNTWKYDKKAWERLSWFFYECCYGNRKILSREVDFEVIVPFLIQFVKEDPETACPIVFDLLRKASNIIGKMKMMKNNKGLLKVLGAVTDCGNDNVSNGVQDEAMDLTKHLYDY